MIKRLFNTLAITLLAAFLLSACDKAAETSATDKPKAPEKQASATDAKTEVKTEVKPEVKPDAKPEAKITPPEPKAVAKTDPTKIRIGWVHAMSNAPLLIAQQKGYFKEEGVDVEIQMFMDGPQIRPAMASGQLDLAYIGAPPVYVWYDKGFKSKIIAKVNYGQAALIVRTDSGINTVEGLRGKKIAGVALGSGMDILLRGYVLTEAGKMDSRKDVEITPMTPGNMSAAVENKVVDGAFTWEPFISASVLKGNTKIILDMNKEIPNHPWYVVMARPESLDTKREAVIKVLRAHRRAVEFLNSSPTAGDDIIIKAFNLEAVKDASGKEISPTEILSAARTRMGWQAEMTPADKDFVQKMIGYSRALGYVQKDINADELIDNSYMDAAKQTTAQVPAAIPAVQPAPAPVSTPDPTPAPATN